MPLQPVSEADTFTFAANLEFLEANFYSFAIKARVPQSSPSSCLAHVRVGACTNQ